MPISARQKHQQPKSPSRSGASADNPNANGLAQLPTHTLRLNAQRDITLVSSVAQFQRMLDDLTGQPLVAYDAEWKPTFCAENELHLIQLATRQHVYLVDVPQLQAAGADWPRLANEVFNSGDIMKLAFSPSSDLLLFGKTLPGFAGIAQTIAGQLDLQVRLGPQCSENRSHPQSLIALRQCGS